MKYYTLLNNIQSKRKTQLQLEPLTYKIPEYVIRNVNANTKVCKLVYSILTINSKLEIIMQIENWENTLSLICRPTTWKIPTYLRITIKTKEL